jgi:hypothetical protein
MNENVSIKIRPLDGERTGRSEIRETLRLNNCEPKYHTGRFPSATVAGLNKNSTIDGKVGRAFSRSLPVIGHLVQTKSHRVKIGNPIKAKARIRFNTSHGVLRLSLTGSVRKIVRNTHLCTSETR